MKLQNGDIVRYLNDVGGGVVQRVVSPTKVEILDNSGFLLPVFEKDLVLIERPTTQSKTEEQQPKQEIPTDVYEEIESDDIEGNDIPLVHIAFVRDAKNSNIFQAYLINDCNYHMLFVLSSESNDEQTHLFSGLLEANTKMMAVQFSYDDISSFETLRFQGVFYKKRVYEHQNTVDVAIKINQVKFYKPGVFVVNDFFDEDAYLITVYDGAKLQEEKENEALQSISPEKLKELILEKNDKNEEIEKPRKKDDTIREVDLHIHELVDNESNMTPAEMLDLQMRTFEKELASAAKSGIEKIVFIHGVGNGILKAKIRGCLDRDYPQFFYQDASFQQYKYGATLVYLRKVYK